MRIEYLFLWVDEQSIAPNFRRAITIKRLIRISFGLLFCLVALFVTFAVQIGQFSTISSSNKADVAIVLGAAVIDGEPSPVFKQRIAHGIQLYQTDQVEMLIFTGGVGEGDTLAESEVGRKQAVLAGIPSEKVLIETESRITQQNLLNACELMKDHRLKTALIVSDPLHMKRSTIIAKDIGLQAFPSPTQTSAYQTWRSKLPSLAYETFFYALHTFQSRHPTC